MLKEATAAGRHRRGWPDRPAAREYLDERRLDLRALQIRYVEAALSRPLSFFVVTAVAPGRSLDLRDVLTGRICRVLERSASISLEASALLMARVLSVDDVSIMLGAGAWVIPPAFHNPIITFRDSFVRGGKLLDEQTAQTLHVDVVRDYRDIVDELMNPRMPTLANTDGDPIAPTTVEFALQSTPCEAFDRLASLAYGYDADALLADARRDGSGTVTAVTVPWTVAGNKVHREWENTSLGTIEIDGRRLTVSVNSEQRARKIRGLPAKRLGDTAVLARQQVESIEALLDKKEGHGPSRRELAQHEALQALPEVRQMMRTHSASVTGRRCAWTTIPQLTRRVGSLLRRRNLNRPVLGTKRRQAIFSAFSTTRGARSMTSRYARVGPSGTRLPCSQWRSVLTLKPNLAANTRCVIPSFVRIALASTWAGTWTR